MDSRPHQTQTSALITPERRLNDQLTKRCLSNLTAELNFCMKSKACTTTSFRFLYAVCKKARHIASVHLFTRTPHHQAPWALHLKQRNRMVPCGVMLKCLSRYDNRHAVKFQSKSLRRNSSQELSRCSASSPHVTTISITKKNREKLGLHSACERPENSAFPTTGKTDYSRFQR